MIDALPPGIFDLRAMRLLSECSRIARARQFQLDWLPKVIFETAWLASQCETRIAQISHEFFNGVRFQELVMIRGIRVQKDKHPISTLPAALLRLSREFCF
jgi:hypothetical protein